MDPYTNPHGNMGWPIRPPIFCPLCGSAHQFSNPISEQDFIVGRLRYLQGGARCQTGRVPVTYTNNPNCVGGMPVVYTNNLNCVVQPHQLTQAQQQLPPSPSLPHLQMLDHVAQFPNYYTRKGYQQAIHVGHGGLPEYYDADPNEEHQIQSPVYPHNSPTLSEDSTVRLDGDKSNVTPRKISRGLSQASMEHIDEFSVAPNPPESSPDLSQASMQHIDEFSILAIPPEKSPGLSHASMEPLDHFRDLPIPQEGPTPDRVRVHNGPSPSVVHNMNLAATEAGLQLLAEFNILPCASRSERSASMPAEGNIRYLQNVAHGTVPVPMPRRPESAPGCGADWDAYQIWEEFPPPPDRHGSTAVDPIMVDDDDDADAEDDNDSVDSDRTVTMAMIASRRNRTPVLPSSEDIVMLSPEDVPIPSVEDTAMPVVRNQPVFSMDIPMPSVEDNY